MGFWPTSPPAYQAQLRGSCEQQAVAPPPLLKALVVLPVAPVLPLPASDAGVRPGDKFGLTKLLLLFWDYRALVSHGNTLSCLRCCLLLCKDSVQAAALRFQHSTVYAASPPPQNVKGTFQRTRLFSGKVSLSPDCVLMKQPNSSKMLLISLYQVIIQIIKIIMNVTETGNGES